MATRAIKKKTAKKTRARKPRKKAPVVAAPSLVKLNLGAGGVEVEGFTSVDIHDGQSAYPLPDYEAGSVDEIRASHLLEHYTEAQALPVLLEWMRVLKPGGRMRIAVPDFESVAKRYGEAPDEHKPVLRAVIMGGQTDEHDHHRSTWTAGKLRDLMDMCGLECIVPWESDVKDCASLDISLNLEGRKGTGAKIVVLMSCPRIGFVDHVFCVLEGLIPLGCVIKRYHGAFWGQGLTNLIEDAIEDGCEFVVSVDYDTLFSPEDARYLVQTIKHRPDIDALCGVQIKREVDSPLCTMIDESTGEYIMEMPVSVFDTELTKLASAHFGLTVLRCSAFKDIERPWFIGKPDPDGAWHDGRMDSDINFWAKWRAAGKTLYQANRVKLGHVQTMATWPTKEFGAVHQYMHDYARDGKPEGVK